MWRGFLLTGQEPSLQRTGLLHRQETGRVADKDTTPRIRRRHLEPNHGHRLRAVERAHLGEDGARRSLRGLYDQPTGSWLPCRTITRLPQLQAP